MPKIARISLFLPLLLTALLPTAKAAQVDAIYAFGDSLSDVGNVFLGTGGAEPGLPYVNGQFSNGPVWLQTLAAGLGLAPLKPSLAGGTDFAYGGAESGTTADPLLAPTYLLGPTGQIAQFTGAHPSADPNALYTIWIGSNDLADISPLASNSEIAADIGAIVGNIDTAIGDLAGLGAKNFLVVTVPDLGKTPAALSQGPLVAAEASQLAAAFDLALVQSLTIFNNPGLKVLDAYTLVDTLAGNPGAFGFTDATTPCLTGAVNYSGGTVCSNNPAIQDQHLFWDQKHPTEAAHALVGKAALGVLSPVATPEPATLSLIAAGLFGIALTRRRKA